MHTMFLYASIWLCATIAGSAQFAKVTYPKVGEAPYQISSRVFVATDGSDSNAGTETSPKLTMAGALEALPWPVSGTSFVEIVMLPGTYKDGLLIRPSDQAKENLRRNVSIRGVGRVVLEGGSLVRNGTQGVIEVRGSHISVQNITIRNATVAGVSIGNYSSDVLIRNVHVEGSVSHGIYAYGCNTVWFDSCSATETCAYQVGQAARSWGSAIKVFHCTNAVISNCVSRKNWGEGININRCVNVLVEGNRAGDNYAGAIYIDMAALVTVRGNLLVSTISDTSHRRFAIPASGISMSNEVHCAFFADCPSAIWTGSENCNYRCSGIGCSFEVRMNDSIEVYNNVIVNAGGGLQIFELFSSDCFRAIRLVNNTYIGNTGHRNGEALSITLPTLVREVNGLEVMNNLFLGDSMAVQLKMELCRFQDNLFAPVRNRIGTNRNVWNLPISCGLTDVTDVFIDYLPSPNADYALSIDPNLHPELRIAGTKRDYVQTDFWGRQRSHFTVGAIECLDPQTSVDSYQLGPDPLDQCRINAEVKLYTLLGQPLPAQAQDLHIRVLQCKCHQRLLEVGLRSGGQ